MSATARMRTLWRDSAIEGLATDLSPTYRSKCRAATIDHLASSGIVGAISNVVASLLFAAVVYRDLPASAVVAWVTAIVLMNAALVTHLRRWQRAPEDERAYARNYRLFAVIYVLLGAIWGTGTALIVHLHGFEQRLFTHMILIALAATCVPGFSLALRPTWLVLGLLLIPTLPLALAAEHALRWPLAVTTFLYFMLLAFYARLIHRSHATAYANRYANEQLWTEVTESKRLSDRLNLRLSEQLKRQKAAEANLIAAKEQAEQAAAAKAQFLANMSHEIRTPMNGVLGMTALLLDTNLTRKQRHFARTIHRSGEALLTIINDILDYSKIEAGKLELRPVVFDLRHLLEDIGVMFAERAHRTNIDYVSVYPAGAHASYRGDPDRLRQILTNLIGNAFKFTQRGEISVSVAVTGERTANGDRLLRFQVRDTGIGIAPEHQSQIFDSFAQADSSTAREFGGTGLGLAICRRLVQLMGGKIGVDSEPGKGSTFWFTCALGEANTESDLNGSAVKLLRDRRILVADENATHRSVIGMQLTLWKAQCVTVATREDALAALEEATARHAPYEIMVLDKQITGTGLRYLSQLHRNPQIAPLKFVVFGSLADLEETGQWLDAGVAAFLAKPVRQNELYEALAEALNVPSRPTGALDRHTDGRLGEQLPHFTGHVLVAEDNPVNQELARTLLENFGCRVEVVDSGRGAIEKTVESLLEMHRDPFDLVLMDVQMPEVDGLAATAAIRAHEAQTGDKRLPIVALTANALEGDRERCLAAQMDDYLAKPFTPKQLALVLARWLPAAAKTSRDRAPARDQSPPPAVAAHHAAPPVTVLDENALARIRELQRDGAPSVLRRVIDLYLDSAPKLVADLRAAVETKDGVRLQRAAHGLKSSSANVGAKMLSELCKELETLGRLARVEDAIHKLAVLDREFEAVRSALALRRTAP